MLSDNLSQSLVVEWCDEQDGKKGGRKGYECSAWSWYVFWYSIECVGDDVSKTVFLRKQWCPLPHDIWIFFSVLGNVKDPGPYARHMMNFSLLQLKVLSETWKFADVLMTNLLLWPLTEFLWSPTVNSSGNGFSKYSWSWGYTSLTMHMILELVVFELMLLTHSWVVCGHPSTKRNGGEGATGIKNDRDIRSAKRIN